VAAATAVLAVADNAQAQDPEKSLYERLGGVFAIAAVVDHFSDAVVKNPIVGQKSKNPQGRSPGSLRRPQRRGHRRLCRDPLSAADASYVSRV
jgi:hypothetical protein